MWLKLFHWALAFGSFGTKGGDGEKKCKSRVGRKLGLVLPRLCCLLSSAAGQQKEDACCVYHAALKDRGVLVMCHRALKHTGASGCVFCLQPVITACGLWRQQRRMPSDCWGGALWCCLTRSSAASAKTCTSSVLAARYGAVRGDCDLLGVTDSFVASGQAFGVAFCPIIGDRFFLLLKSWGSAGPKKPFSCCCSQCRVLCLLL